MARATPMRYPMVDVYPGIGVLGQVQTLTARLSKAKSGSCCAFWLVVGNQGANIGRFTLGICMELRPISQSRDHNLSSFVSVRTCEPELSRARMFFTFA